MTTIRFDDRTLRLEFDGLPALTGTEKQVAWAEDIRLQALERDVRRPFEHSLRQAGANREAWMATAVAQLNERLSPVLDKITSAKLLIDTRGHSLREIAAKL